MAVPVTKGVVWKVQGLALERDGNKIKATFKIPAGMTDSESGSRATWIDHELRLDRLNSNYVPIRTTGMAVGSWNGSDITRTGADRYWIRGQIFDTTIEKNYDRSWFHPLKLHVYCNKVVWYTWGGNGMVGDGWGVSMKNIGPVVRAERRIQLPRAPIISWNYNQSNSTATVTVKTDEGNDWYERYDTMYRVMLRKADGKEITLRGWRNSCSTEIKESFDLSPYLGNNMSIGKYITIKCQAYARGMAGDNPTPALPITSVCSVCWPAAATIGAITCSSKSSTGRITVSVTPGKAFASTTQLQLERATSTDRNWNGVSPEGNWTTVSGATDNGDCKALYDTYADANPQPGVYTFYRVRSERHQYHQYSAVKRADCLYTAKPKETCSATCKLVSLTSNSAGDAITVVMAWKDSTSNTGCELSMSPYPNGWNTSESPSTWTLTGSDSPTKLKGWTTRTYTVNSGIEPGGTYYFRMRRYKTYPDSGNTRYSAYDIPGKATPVKAESATDDKCCILSIAVSGTTATVTVGINEDNVNDGTEITWADHSDAWRSNEQPSSFNATWARSANTGNASWPYKQVIYLRGLGEGKTYWVRARRYKGNTFSGYSATKQFSIPAGAASANYDPRCGLVSVTDVGDGESAVVVVGWDGDHTGCEVSWSADANAWESSDQPSSMSFEWQDATRKSTAWSHTSTIYLRGLVEGVTHYVRARSYYDGDGETVWSDYTDDVTITPYSAPDSVTLTAPDAVARGEAIECWWAISGEMEQTDWAIHRDGYPKSSLASGNGSLCHASIPADRYEGLDAIDFYVDASTGGEMTKSNVVSVGIADYPTCEVLCDPVLTSQPFAFEVYTDNDTVSLRGTLRSEGVTVSAPDGDRDQLPGDVVWTQAFTPTLTATTWGATSLYVKLSSAVDEAQDAYDAAVEASVADPTDEDKAVAAENAAVVLIDAQNELAAHPSTGSVNMAAITLPDTLSLLDGASYTLSVQTVEPIAELVSNTATAKFDVVWAHQAVAPAATLTVDSDERSVSILLGTPNDAVSDDVCDIYRMTPAGHELIAESIPMGGELTDPYAPFGADDLHYRISLRTVDGDFAFIDFPYVMKVVGSRFDWDGKFVELPYNLVLSEGYQKDYEARSHSDGSVNGYYGPAVGMTFSLSSDVVKVDYETLRLLREMANYPGPVFCRSQNGLAFQGNVELSELGTSYNNSSMVSPVSLDVTYEDLTDQFKCQGGDTNELESDGGEG